jgi:hypothetical protein
MAFKPVHESWQVCVAMGFGGIDVKRSMFGFGFGKQDLECVVIVRWTTSDGTVRPYILTKITKMSGSIARKQFVAPSEWPTEEICGGPSVQGRDLRTAVLYEVIAGAQLGLR